MFCSIIANRKFNETCKTHQQCTGTDNADTCNFGDGVCSCNNKYTAINGKCLEGKNFMYLFKMLVNCVCKEILFKSKVFSLTRKGG